MNANLNSLSHDYRLIRSFAAGVLLLLGGLPHAWAQTITSDPADGATGVSVSAAVTFTFSSAVDPTQTTASFYSTSPPGAYPVNSSWSSGNTVLTCTPISPFPANATISWAVIVNVSPMPVFATGSFSTGTGGGGGGGGTGTNAITTFAVGKLYFYEQTNSSPPTLNPNVGYGFTASTSLASNLAATQVTVTIPGASSPTSLSQNPSRHEDYSFLDYFITNEMTFESTYPQGNYAFKVTATSSNLQGTVSMPTTMLQPNAPHILNFSNTQAVIPAQALTVTWDPFQGGTASDYISLAVSGSSGEVFQTPGPGTNGALMGTAISATIPPNILTNGTSFDAEVVFYRFTVVSNGTYATFAYRATGTQFTINAAGSASTVPVVSAPILSGSNIGFDVATAPNQVLIVKYSTDCSQPMSQWQTVLTTNSPGTSVHITLSAQAAAAGFFRLQNGP